MKSYPHLRNLVWVCLVGLLPARAQEAGIVPDPNLASAVRIALGLPNATPITAEMMVNITAIHIIGKVCDDDDDDDDPRCVNQPVKDLTGLQHASNLHTLILSGPEHVITDLRPIQNLTNLRVLSLPHAVKAEGEILADLTDVIAGFRSLQVLELPGVGLRDKNFASFEPLVQLRTLDVTGNFISDLTPLRHMTRLESLEITNNPIVDLSPLEDMQRLRRLRFLGTTDDLISLPPLRRLPRIYVHAIDLGPLARLERIDEVTSYRSVTDLTPLANLEQLWSFNLSGNHIEDLAPLGLTPAFRPYLANIAAFASIDLSRPSNAAIVEQWKQNGTLPRDIAIPQDRLWQPQHFIPDGELRAFISQRLNITQSELRPEHLSTKITADGTPLKDIFGRLRSFEGLQHLASLRNLEAPGGRIVDLSPLSQIGLEDASINLYNNFINDVTPLVGKPFRELELRGNPINPATVPEAWWSDPRIHLDPRKVLDLQEAIPDQDLRTAIRIALQLPVTAAVKREQVERLEFLHAEGRGIQSLAGLENARQLKGLALRNNVLASLAPVAHLPALQWLRISGNVPDASVPAVVASLRTRGVHVDDDPAGRFLSAIAPIQGVVYADAYQLASLRYLQIFPEVTELFLSHNYLRDIHHLEALPNLVRVHLSENLLRLEPGHPARRTVDALRGRGVSVRIEPQRPEATKGTPFPDDSLHRAIADSLGLPVVPAGFTQVEVEAVTELDWENMYPLIRPQLTHPESLRRLTNITRLSLENAGLSDVQFLASLPHLTSLDLDFNYISDISAMSGLTELSELDINNNLLVDISPLAGLTTLTSLDIDQNAINDISPLAGLQKLSFLDLHSNQVSDLTPLASLSSLTSLDLKDNHIQDIEPLACLVALADLRLNYNRINSFVPLRGLTSLKRLNVQFNLNSLTAEDRMVLDELAPSVSRLSFLPQFHSSPEVIFSPEGVLLQWWGEDGVLYNVTSSPDLKGWTQLGFMVGAGAPLVFRVDGATESSRFFEVTP